MRLSLRAPFRHQRGFSLPELLVTLAVSILISIAVVGSQLFGIRLTEMTQAKIQSSDQARQLTRLFTSDIQTARLVRVGNGTASSFTEAPPQSPQQGNALQIYPTADTNVYVRYFRSAGDSTLSRVKNGSVTPVATHVSTISPFTLEDFRGNVLLDRQYNAIVGINLQFSRLENPDLPVGPQHHYKSHQFKTRIALPLL